MSQIESDKRRILKASDDPKKDVTNWKSIYCATVLSFIGSIQFSLYFSSLWSYIQILDHGTSEKFFGNTIALYSFGQIISSVLFGLWANRVKQVRPPLYAGLILMFIGNIMYILMELIHFIPKRYVLLATRFIIGLGSGNVATLRCYASTASTTNDRTKAISFITGGQAIGLVIGPVFQLVFTPLDYPGMLLFNSLSINLYTAPAYLACLMNIAGFTLQLFLFQENHVGIVEKPKNITQSNSTNSTTNDIPSYDRLAVFICYLTKFTDMFVRTNLEVLGSALAMMFFGLNESRSVTVLSITQGCLGGLTLVVYIAYVWFKVDRLIQLRTGCAIALIGFVLFHLLTFSWPFLPEHVKLTSELNTTDDAIGCNSNRFTWCTDLTTTNIWLFYGSYAIIIGLAFPLLTISLSTLFSKILGPIRQGKEQGLLQGSSAFARIIGPLAASTLYSTYGPRLLWILELSVVMITLSLWLIFYKRMIPLQMNSNSDKLKSVFCKLQITTTKTTNTQKNPIKVHPTQN